MHPISIFFVTVLKNLALKGIFSQFLFWFSKYFSWVIQCHDITKYYCNEIYDIFYVYLYQLSIYKKINELQYVFLELWLTSKLYSIDRGNGMSVCLFPYQKNITFPLLFVGLKKSNMYSNSKNSVILNQISSKLISIVYCTSKSMQNTY